MKKIYLLLLLMLVGLYIGCSKSADDSPDPDKPKAVDKTANLLSTGDSAKDLLSNEKFTTLKVEIAYAEGFRPTQEAMVGFVNFLKETTFKEEVELVYSKLEPSGKDSLNLDDISDLESTNRTVYNDGNTMGVYIYFSDAPAEGDDLEEGLVTLGAVYRNTSMIIHEVTVRKLAGQSIFISEADVESATLNHEFGHLFGLVNLGTDAINDHEDIQRDDSGDPVLDDNGNTSGNSHCSVEGCLMRAELQFGGPSNKRTSKTAKADEVLHSSCSLSGKSVLKMLQLQAAKGQADPPGLDSECILDLQSNGGR